MVKVRLDQGGEAELIALSADRITLRATIAKAPGAPLIGSLESGSMLRVKVHRCRRDGADVAFVMEGRLVDATRQLREELARLLSPPTPEP
jgi:hypothetical protein